VPTLFVGANQVVSMLSEFAMRSSTCEYASLLMLVRDKNPNSEQTKMAAKGVCPLFVRPRVFAIRFGRYVCESTNTVREAVYNAVLLLILV
jgi:hypothetical protein